MEIVKLLNSLPVALRILLIIILAVLAHFLVRGIRRLSQWLMSLRLAGSDLKTENIVKRYPKIVTVTTILVSAFTFTIYFMAVGLILREFNISLTAYLASASVIGLAIGFGAQGFVQDVVIGLTLIFSDTLDIGDVVELSGQVGQVDKIGLRFTTLINLHGQQIYIPNRLLFSHQDTKALRFYKVNPSCVCSPQHYDVFGKLSKLIPPTPFSWKEKGEKNSPLFFPARSAPFSEGTPSGQERGRGFVVSSVERVSLKKVGDYIYNLG